MKRAASLPLNRHAFQSSPFATETTTAAPRRHPTAAQSYPATLYDAQHEKDSCGVGFVAGLSGEAQRRVVTNAIEMLERMHHRGGCGCEPNSGDGAGMMSGIPHAFLRDQVSRQSSGSPAFSLPEAGAYAVGQLFVPKRRHRSRLAADGTISAARGAMESALSSRGLNVLGWRSVPTDNSDLGPTSLSTEPHVEQVFVGNSLNLSHEAFERELLLARKRMESLVSRLDPDPRMAPYLCSLSSRTIVYKGQLHSGQLLGYYPDLQDDAFASHMTLVHSRFSTNTFPSWERAQPYRMLCHNGEINTLRGNKNWMNSRGPLLRSPYFGHETRSLHPVVSDELSDSGNLDAVAELIVRGSAKSMPEVMMQLVPEAYENALEVDLSPARRALCEFNALQMEPWDGPAMIAFTDGRFLGACLDRNGLRPSRYFVTDDGLVVLSSEVGVTPQIDDRTVSRRERLEPGRLLMIDFEKGEICNDTDVKEGLARAHPYSEWLKRGLVHLDDWVSAHAAGSARSVAPDFDWHTTNNRLNMHGFTRDHLDVILAQMVETGKDALGSMGTDTPTAVLSSEPVQISDFFKQLFAQVTNPPIDPIREASVMTLECPVGPEHNLLETSESHARRLMVKSPVLSLEQLAAVLDGEYRGWRSAEIDATYANLSPDTTSSTGAGYDYSGAQSSALFVRGAGAQMAAALDRICAEVSEAIESGEPSVIVLSDRSAGPDRLPVPSLLAAGAVHHHLLRTRQRCQVALFVDSGDACTVHDACTLIGFGVDAFCPRHAYEAIALMERDGLAEAAKIVAGHEAKRERLHRPSELFKNYTKAIETGILKVMSKMGISTLRSYKGAQIFEAVGLADEVIERCFAGTPSRIAGAGWDALHFEAVRKLAFGFPPESSSSQGGADAGATRSPPPPPSSPRSSSSVPLRRTGQFHFVPGAEKHYNDPHGMTMLQEAARTDSRKAYRRYAKHLDGLNRGITLRGMLRFVEDHDRSVPLSEVEPVSEIVKRFCTGAMSLGSISSEAHETLAVAMNRLGGRSNTGEGGEDPRRFEPSTYPDAQMMTHEGDTKRSAIKQIASGRFGVTSNYLANADQLQIKIAQGAKPGEGGELPGAKVHGLIAETRRVTPGTGLISPPPHHDIYSIEDLAQLIHDLKSSNPSASVSTKLVSEVGVGVVAAGVAKARSDHITVSGGDGGTGAAAWTGIKHAGLPWELGIAETQQTLVLNDLRSRVVLQADGQLKTARDIVVATLLGAEEFALSTAPLIAMGCIMMRKCHLNTCPVGIATQDPELRAKFQGKPEHVVNFLWLLAEDVREHMAMLGFRTMDDMVGHADRLEIDPTATHYKSEGLDLSAMLVPAGTLNSGAPVRNTSVQDHELETAIDCQLIEKAMDVLESHVNATATPSSSSDTSIKRVVIEAQINNLDRSTGAWLSNEVSKRFGEKGLPDDSIEVRFQGQAGQSFGFTCAKGVTLRLDGEANDGCGKGLSGGRIIVRPNDDALNRGDIASEDQIITGNVALYGATSGSAFFRGIAGERFCVRNSGATTVVEGVGDHGCEYMTGGRVVVLGNTGNNFGAGMSGGRAFVYDRDAVFHQRVNHEMVLLETLDEWGPKEEDELLTLIQVHVDETRSEIGRRILENWQEERRHFVKVMPKDYKRALLGIESEHEDQVRVHAFA